MKSLFLYGIRGYFIVSIVFKQPTIGVFTFGIEFWKKLCSFLLGNRLRWMDSAHFKSYYSFTQRYFIRYLTDDCFCSFFKAVDGCLYLTCLPSTYGRKNPKYQKKPVFSHYTSERALTYEEIDEFKLTFDCIVNAKRGY